MTNEELEKMKRARDRMFKSFCAEPEATQPKARRGRPPKPEQCAGPRPQGPRRRGRPSRPHAVKAREAETLGALLTAKRVGAGLFLRQLAEKLGVAEMTVHKWEVGRSIPSLYMLVDLANLYDCTLDELVGRVNDDNA